MSQRLAMCIVIYVILILKSHRIHGTGIFTLPETNVAPESRSLEKEIPIGTLHF